jgi:hypothetical protein
VCKYGLTVKCLSTMIPSSLKELEGFTYAPLTLMVKVSLALAMLPTITYVLAPLSPRPLSLVYFTMALTSRCSTLCASRSSAMTQTAVSSA